MVNTSNSIQIGNFKLTYRFIGLVLLTLSLVAQALAGVVFVQYFDFDLRDQGDTAEFMDIADNLLAGHGYSAEAVEPYRPTASRSPGTIIFNVPFWFFFKGQDMLATIFAKGILLLSAIATFYLTKQMIGEKWAYIAAAIITILPTTAYYGVNPYSTGSPYLLSFGLMYLGIALALNGNKWAWIGVFIGSAYVMSMRPAAIFPLLMTSLTAFAISWLFDPVLRRHLLIVALASFLGFMSVQLSWSYRNFKLFDSFQYSSVQGFNVLHFNVRYMKPFLDAEAQQEIDDAIESLPIYIHTYHGQDQLLISAEQGEEGVRLIKKYPVAFFASHMLGTMEGFFLFEAKIIQDLLGEPAALFVGAIQTLLTGIAAIGIFKSWRSLDNSARAVIIIIFFTGMLSVASGGALGRPKFRIPLEPLVAIGIVLFLRDVVVLHFNKSHLKLS